MKTKKVLQQEALVRREKDVRDYQGNEQLKAKLAIAENEVEILKKKIGSFA